MASLTLVTGGETVQLIDYILDMNAIRVAVSHKIVIFISVSAVEPQTTDTILVTVILVMVKDSLVVRPQVVVTIHFRGGSHPTVPTSHTELLDETAIEAVRDMASTDVATTTIQLTQTATQNEPRTVCIVTLTVRYV